MKRLIPIMILISLLAGCNSIPPIVLSEGARIARAILTEYQPEREQIADSLLEAIAELEQTIRRFKEIGIPYEPEQMDWELILTQTMGEAGIDQEVIDKVLAELFPPPDALALRLEQRPKRYDHLLKAVAKELKRE